MKVTFLGGAGEYGRSCFLLQGEDISLLIDCGVMKNAKTVETKYPLLNEQIAKNVDAVFITHSHEDHSAAIPYLYELGYRGKIFTTEPTRKQIKKVFTLWRETEDQTGQELPYSKQSEKLVQFEKLDLCCKNQWIPLMGKETIHFMYGCSGHTLGSVWFFFRFNGKYVFFSGDYSMESSLLSFEKPNIEERVDLAILDGAYGSELNDQDSYIIRLREMVMEANEKGEKVLFHGPVVGKMQELLFSLFMSLQESVVMTFTVSEDILLALEDYERNQACLKKENYQWFKEKVVPKLWVSNVEEWLQDGELGIGFFLENEIVGYSHWKHSSPLKIITTGPLNDNIRKLVCENDHLQYEKYRFKVHPGVEETKHMLRFLTPKQTVFTHGPTNLALELKEALTLDEESTKIVEVSETVG
ncbi:MBL fold metallo-hydrolase [Evansella sp. AB-rgal1]|uniref:MBL fold metallo-hydrolase n=1 Tax=Evansella sp. AB-rgal1 TaxID=3242696 RepID=UPI00359ED097